MGARRIWFCYWMFWWSFLACSRRCPSSKESSFHVKKVPIFSCISRSLSNANIDHDVCCLMLLHIYCFHELLIFGVKFICTYMLGWWYNLWHFMPLYFSPHNSKQDIASLLVLHQMMKVSLIITFLFFTDRTLLSLLFF